MQPFRVWECHFGNNLSVLWLVMNTPSKVSSFSHWICFRTNNPVADRHDSHGFLFVNIVACSGLLWSHGDLPGSSWCHLFLSTGAYWASPLPPTSPGPFSEFLEVRKQPRSSERGEWSLYGSTFNIYWKNTNSYSNILKIRNASLNSTNFSGVASKPLRLKWFLCV